jgi:hypothetical protein
VELGWAKWVARMLTVILLFHRATLDGGLNVQAFLQDAEGGPLLMMLARRFTIFHQEDQAGLFPDVLDLGQVVAD